MNLTKYEELRSAVEELRLSVNSREIFRTTVKKNPRFVRLRREARNELKAVYDTCAREFGLPDIEVFLPVRLKISVRGIACHSFGIPTEIRVYFIEGCSTKPSDDWSPQDIVCCSASKVFEILLHETAHVLEAHRNGEMGHERPFVEAYDEIEAFLQSSGFNGLRDPTMRLWGVPDSSYAAIVSAASARASSQDVEVKGRGCLSLFVMVVLWLTAVIGLEGLLR